MPFFHSHILSQGQTPRGKRSAQRASLRDRISSTFAIFFLFRRRQDCFIGGTLPTPRLWSEHVYLYSEFPRASKIRSQKGDSEPVQQQGLGYSERPRHPASEFLEEGVSKLRRDEDAQVTREVLCISQFVGSA
jgi:hypothetical protein